ncbi:MAG: hypothetical protein DHS20C21_03930 [Gemmatimonadota bacterium]|nr:MAG: hypothetical protein DHS20C21_03930 [Gemmatimonadota bacterium]
MSTDTPRRKLYLALAWIAIAVPAAHAQPTLDSLWPNADQSVWRYQLSYSSVFEDPFTSPATLRFNGEIVHHGHELQVLEASHGIPSERLADGPDLPPVLRAIWQARPDLREALEQRYATGRGAGDWWPLFLHDGYFQKSPISLRMWQAPWSHPTWTYLETPLLVGETFTHQLVPELADDIFLHGTVASIDAAASTPAGEFSNAVKIEYLIDAGVQQVTDASGVLLGRLHSEVRGHVHYVPDVGPVEVVEEHFPYVWIDCAPSDCPEEWVENLGIATHAYILSLTEAPTSIERSSWAATKASFR